MPHSLTTHRSQLPRSGMALGGIGTGGSEIRQDAGFANRQIFKQPTAIRGKALPVRSEVDALLRSARCGRERGPAARADSNRGRSGRRRDRSPRVPIHLPVAERGAAPRSWASWAFSTMPTAGGKTSARESNARTTRPEVVIEPGREHRRRIPVNRTPRTFLDELQADTALLPGSLPLRCVVPVGFRRRAFFHSDCACRVSATVTSTNSLANASNCRRPSMACVRPAACPAST